MRIGARTRMITAFCLVLVGVSIVLFIPDWIPQGAIIGNVVAVVGLIWLAIVIFRRA